MLLQADARCDLATSNNSLDFFFRRGVGEMHCSSCSSATVRCRWIMICLLQVARIEVGGLHCTSCSSATEKALSVLTGVRRASVSLSLQQAEVEFDPELVSEVMTLATFSIEHAKCLSRVCRTIL